MSADRSATLAFRCADDDGAWVLSIGPDGVTTSVGVGVGAGTPQCTVRGAAGDLYLALWQRAGRDRLHIEGDASVLDAFGDAVRIP